MNYTKPEVAILGHAVRYSSNGHSKPTHNHSMHGVDRANRSL